ncbi:hypothetical protein E2C01_087963 [Portunus trituberculatus]|uniref:Uncharacterized protein n=1 Tax=Portunus trituberculatus TaxID=210409 RepID=A0A5B7J9I4_PORTR|nr:hypothetical protein [Portunus trituberculatus]
MKASLTHRFLFPPSLSLTDPDNGERHNHLPQHHRQRLHLRLQADAPHTRPRLLRQSGSALQNGGGTCLSAASTPDRSSPSKPIGKPSRWVRGRGARGVVHRAGWRGYVPPASCAGGASVHPTRAS